MGIISINHNLPAASTANNLSKNYSRLATSVERLSTGLRINSAADDAAGLAIRELQRADIAALQQGMRNVNDAISMIQTFDGALSVIDEKLIRMKELAEQAATGTYDSTQRLMIDSEFQAMGEEINRIARATDFNGIKLLDGKGLDEDGDAATFAINVRAVVPAPDGTDYNVNASTTKIINKVWPNASASQVGAWDLSGISDPSKLAQTSNITISNANIPSVGNNYLMITPANISTDLPPGSVLNISWDSTVVGNRVFVDWTVNGYSTTDVPPKPGANISGSASGFTYSGPDANGNPVSCVASFSDENGNPVALNSSGNLNWTVQPYPSFTSNIGTTTSYIDPNDPELLVIEVDLGDNNIVKGNFRVPGGEDRALASVSVRLTSRQRNNPNNPNDPNGSGDTDPGSIPPLFTDKVKIHFGTMNDSAEDYYYVNKHDATLKGLGLEGVDIQTQDKAQKALVQINDAIVAKDKIRAEYGATQNRFENTLTNLTIQAENLQASESRISDADIAQEMTTFVRNQVLTQSAVAMLTQANSMPQMVMRLIQ